MAFLNDAMLKKLGRAAMAAFSAAALSVTLAGCGGSAVSEDPAPEPVEISDKTFPDDGFRGYVEEQFDQDSDGTLSAEEIECVETINVYGDGVSSFEGVQHFVNLTTFCYTENVYVTNIDLSRNTKLANVEVKGECESTVVLPVEMDEADADCSSNVTVVVDEEEPEDAPEDEAEGEDSADDGESAGSEPPAETDSVFVSSNASSWVQQYNGIWYSDGVPSTMEFRSLSMDGTEPLGLDSASFVIRDGYVYYLEGCTYDLGVASLYRQPLDGGEPLLLSSEVSADEFYLADGYIYFMAALGEYGEESCAARVSVDGEYFEYLYKSSGWLVGASEFDGSFFMVDYDAGALVRYSKDMEEKTEYLNGCYNIWDFGELEEGRLYYAVYPSPEDSYLRMVIFEDSGFITDEITLNGGYNYASWANPTWTDDEKIYVASDGGIDVVGWASVTDMEWMDLNVPSDSMGNATPLFVDQDSVYYGVSYEYSEYAEYTAAVCRYDRATGETEIVDAWYEQ